MAAAAVLVALVVLTPWPFGGVRPGVTRAIALVALGTVLAVAAWRARHDEGTFAATGLPLWPFAALLALGAFQLLPLPEALLRLAAPGPAAIWHPADPATGAVLGDGPRPASVFPEATRRTVAFGAGITALGLLAVPALRRRRVACVATVAVVAGALLVGAFGIVARTLFADRIYGVFPVPTIAPFGPFVSKNHFAGYVEMAALLALGLGFGLADEARRSAAALSWASSPRASRIVAAFGAAAGMALAILVSQSRGGALSLAAGALAFVVLRPFVRQHGRRRHVVVGALAFVVLAAVTLAILPPESRARLASLVGITSESAGGGARLVVWGDSLRLAGTSPLVGSGFGAYADALSPVRSGLAFVRVEHAESDVLELLAEGGIVGFGCALAALALLAVAVFRGLSTQADRLRRGIGLGASAAVIALLVHALFDFNLRLPSNALLFVLCTALALASATESRPTPEPTRWPWAGAAVAAALLAALVATPAAPGAVLPGEARPFATTGSRPLTPLRIRQASEALAREVRRRPLNAEAWLVLAWLRAAEGSGKDAQALARHAAVLDPQNEPLQTHARRLGDGR